MSIKCSTCGTINKDAAKYCAKCGKALSNNSFVQEKFPEIKFQVASKYNEFTGIGIILSVLYWYVAIFVSIFPIALTTITIEESGIDFYSVDIYVWIVLAVLVLLIEFLLIRLVIWAFLRIFKLTKNDRNKIKLLKQQCSLTEKGIGMTKRYIRVYKDGKLGMVDRYESTIILNIDYDNIKKLESKMFIIEQYGKCGLFNALSGKIIIPVMYEKIEIYGSDIFSAFDGYNTDYFNTDGEQL